MELILKWIEMQISLSTLTLKLLVALVWWQWRQECVAWWEGYLLDVCCFCLGGFIAVVARGNPGVSGLSPSLSQHFQYYTILSHSSLSSGVSISFLCSPFIFGYKRHVSPPPLPDNPALSPLFHWNRTCQRRSERQHICWEIPRRRWWHFLSQCL